MWLHRKDLAKVTALLNDFPDVQMFELEQQGENGIGTVTVLSFSQAINGHDGVFKIEIAGVEDW